MTAEECAKIIFILVMHLVFGDTYVSRLRILKHCVWTLACQVCSCQANLNSPKIFSAKEIPIQLFQNSKTNESFGQNQLIK